MEPRSTGRMSSKGIVALPAGVWAKVFEAIAYKQKHGYKIVPNTEEVSGDHKYHLSSSSDGKQIRITVEPFSSLKTSLERQMRTAAETAHAQVPVIPPVLTMNFTEDQAVERELAIEEGKRKQEAGMSHVQRLQKRYDDLPVNFVILYDWEDLDMPSFVVMPHTEVLWPDTTTPATADTPSSDTSIPTTDPTPSTLTESPTGTTSEGTQPPATSPANVPEGTAVEPESLDTTKALRLIALLQGNSS